MDALPSIADALALVLERVTPLPAEHVGVEAAAGRVLASAARATVDLPPFPSSAMDGYAVRSADTPGALQLVDESAAGSPATRQLAEGEAIAISTGAVVPEGADAVVPVERTSRDVDVVTVDSVGPGENVRPRAGDVAAGDEVVAAGTRIRPPQLAALAASGIATLSVARRPRATVVATGSELRRPGEPLAPGEIYESNSLLLAAALTAAGCDVTLLEAVGDEEDATRDAIAAGLEGDVLVTTGGVSVGPHDLVRPALAELGADEVFWRVALKPGKPIAFWTRESTLVFALPGNPVSSLVGFELFVKPAVAALQGAAAPGPAFLAGRLGRSVRRTPNRDELVRARSVDAGDATVLEPLGGQDSHMIVRAAAADALVLIEHGEGEVAAGAAVRYLPI